MAKTKIKLETQSGSDKYFIVKINIWKDIVWALIVGVILALIFGALKIYDPSIGFTASVRKLEVIPCIIWYLKSFLVSFIVKTIFINNISVNLKILNADFDIGNGFFKLLSSLLRDLENPTENKNKLTETSYFLKANNARSGHMLQFSPDNESINLLHKVEGMISITQADPSEWLNPTYNFFLVNNYVAAITQAISLNSPISSIQFSNNRDDPRFKEFEINKKEILKQLSEAKADGSLVNFLKERKIFVRFYILSEDEIANNKSIIETLIAGHDLFGCYLFFVNEKFYREKFKTLSEYTTFLAFIQSIDYNLADNSDKVDFAVAEASNKLNVIYRKGDELIPRPINYNNTILLEAFLIKLSDFLYKHYDDDDYLFDQYFNTNNFVKNDKFCYIIIEKEKVPNEKK